MQNKDKAIIILLVVNIMLFVLSFLSTLNGPAWGIILGIVGFLMSACFIAAAKSKSGVIYLSNIPQGLLDSRIYSRLNILLSILWCVLIINFVVGFITLVISSYNVGVATGFILSGRSEYILCNHGVMTEVSRIRFIAVGLSFMIVWHSGASLMPLYCIRRLLFGFDNKQ